MVRLSIDKAIANERAKAEMYRFRIINRLMTMLEIEECERGIEEHEQLAEWLEELKVLRLQNHLGRDESLIAGRKEGYNKAIDDFVEKISIEISESVIYGMLVDSRKYNGFNDTSDRIVDYVVETSNEIAEQLKEGESE